MLFQFYPTPARACWVGVGGLGGLLGQRGLWALGRLMGMILTIVAVQMFTNGITELVVHICSSMA